MKTKLILILLLIFTQILYASSVNKIHIIEDFNEIISDLANNYIYFQDKGIDLNCIKEKYIQRIDAIENEEQLVLFFEILLDEFYDSHLILNTNRDSSYRLYAPIYASLTGSETIISSVWLSQLATIEENIIGAQILKFNGVGFNKSINDFPTVCQDKTNIEIRQWLTNKILAGRYNQTRILTLKLSNGKVIELDLDKLRVKQSKNLLSSSIKNDIGIIRINDTLGANKLVTKFDDALDDMFDTKGLIIDLRNTVGGGNSFVARGIMGRFIQQTKPYQKHWTIEKYDNSSEVVRSWVEYVSPRLKTYQKPVVILVGRWTGSMGEGLAIGFEGIGKAKIVGTEMGRLAGEMNGFGFKHQKYGYRLSTAKLFHVNGSPREKYVPTHYIQQTSIKSDESFIYALKLLRQLR